MRWLFHFMAYYITWFVCIAYAAADDPWTGPIIGLSLVIAQIGLQIISQSKWCYELFFACVLMFLGIAVDTLLLNTGWILFLANPFANYLSPPWMACLWLSFGFTITVTSRAWLHRYVLLGVLTFISLPFAYWIGVMVGAATVKNLWFYPLLGGMWMVFLPQLLKGYMRISSNKA